MKPPTLDTVQKKAKEIDSSKNFLMKEEDIEQV